MKIEKEDLDRIDKAIRVGNQMDFTSARQMYFIKAIALCLREIVAREFDREYRLKE